MVDGRAVLAAILGGVLAACGAGAAPSQLEVASPIYSPIMTITPASASPTDAAAPVSPSPSPTPRTTPKPTAGFVPPMPTGVTFDEQVKELADGSYSITYTVKWRDPTTEGVEIRVYGVMECLSAPTTLPTVSDSGPCLVEHTALPASVRKQLATAPASDRAASWTWTGDPGCDVGWVGMGADGTVFSAVVLAAYGPSDHSIFAIAQPGEWVSFDPTDMPC